MATSTIKQNFVFTAVSSIENYGTYISGGYCKIGDTVIVDVIFTKKTDSSAGKSLLSGFPGGKPDNSSSLVGIRYSTLDSTPVTFRIWNGDLYPNSSHSAGNYHIYGIYKA